MTRVLFVNSGFFTSRVFFADILQVSSVVGSLYLWSSRAIRLFLVCLEGGHIPSAHAAFFL